MLWGVYYLVSHIKVEEPTEPTVYVWDIVDNELVHINIELPAEGLSQSFIKIEHDDQFPWFFDDEQNTPVDTERWGGGIPLLLSGPSADRIITEAADTEQLARYGLTDPSLRITLKLEYGEELVIDVGDSTVDGINYYVKSPYSTGVATVDYTWYEVLSGLVTDPPYVPAEEE
jgi:hypothetical protein